MIFKRQFKNMAERRVAQETTAVLPSSKTRPVIMPRRLNKFIPLLPAKTMESKI